MAPDDSHRVSLLLNHYPKATPMVLLVHGGPWARDSWGYNSAAQVSA